MERQQRRHDQHRRAEDWTTMVYGVHYSFAVQHGADATELHATKAVCAAAF
jgi:hypothetical protein